MKDPTTYPITKEELAELVIGPECAHELAQRPWLLDGGTVATNGKCLLWLEQDFGFAPLLDEAFGVRNIRKWIARAEGLPRTKVTVAHLRKWMGPEPVPIVCPQCKGTLIDPDMPATMKDRPCWYCEQTGIDGWRPYIRIGHALSLSVDPACHWDHLAAFADVVAHNGGDVGVCVSMTGEKDDVKTLFLWGRGAMMILMPRAFSSVAEDVEKAKALDLDYDLSPVVLT